MTASGRTTSTGRQRERVWGARLTGFAAMERLAIQRKQGSLEVRVVSAEGKLLVNAAGYGESTFRRSSNSSVLGRVFDEIYYRLFPDE